MPFSSDGNIENRLYFLTAFVQFYRVFWRTLYIHIYSYIYCAHAHARAVGLARVTTYKVNGAQRTINEEIN